MNSIFKKSVRSRGGRIFLAVLIAAGICFVAFSTGQTVVERPAEITQIETNPIAESVLPSVPEMEADIQSAAVEVTTDDSISDSVVVAAAEVPAEPASTGGSSAPAPLLDSNSSPTILGFERTTTERAFIQGFFSVGSPSFGLGPPVLLSFTRQAPGFTPTSADNLTFRATFDEDVQNVDTADFSVNGTTTATVTNVISVTASTYDVTVSGGDLVNFNGVVGLDLAVGQDIQDLDAIPQSLPAGEPATDETYTVDNDPPDVSSITRLTPATTPTNADNLVFRVTFDEDVMNVDATDFSVSGTTTATVTNVTSVTASNYDVTVSGGDLATFNGVVGLDLLDDDTITDLVLRRLGGNGVGNGDFTTGETYLLDNIGPTPTVEQAAAQSDPTSTQPINFTIDFGESVNNFDSGDLVFGGTAPGTPAGVITGGPDVYNAAVSGLTGDGTITVSLNIGAAQDDAGNSSAASTSADNEVTFDGLPEIDVQRPAGTSIPDGGSDALGTQTVGTVNLTYTIDNTAGLDTLNIPALVISNTVNVSGFSSSSSFPLTVAAGGTDTLNLSFNVDGNGAFSFDLDIQNDDPDENPYDIQISGTGLAVPEIDIQRPAGTSITDGGTDALGAQTVGTVNLTYTIDNTAGSAALTVTGVTGTSFSNVSGYSLNTATPIVVPAGGTSTFDISFNVDINGAFSLDLAVANDDADENPYDIQISGTGTGGAPEIDVQRPASTSIADGGSDVLGAIAVGGVNLTYTVDNTAGTDTLSISGVTASSLVNVSGFSLNTATPINVTAGNTATFNISFNVDANGVFSLDLDIANDDADENPYDIQISGTGTGGAPEIDIQRPASTSIADGGTDALGATGIGTVNLTYTIDNMAGTEELNVTGITATNFSNVSNFSLSTPTPINVAAGATGIFIISFDVDLDGAFSFDLDIANDDADENPYDILISGTGTGGLPEIDVQRPAGTSIADGGSDSLGNPAVGGVNLTYTLDNTLGTGQLTVTGVTASGLVNTSGFSLNTATPINVAPGATGSFNVSFNVDAAGAFSLDIDIANNDGDEDPYDIQISGTAADLVVVMGGNTSPLDGAVFTTGPTSLAVQFNKDVQTGGGPGAADNPANYIVVEAGGNGIFDTVNCRGGVVADDTAVLINSITYDGSSYTATLNINGGVPLPVGSYRLYVCGTTSVEDLLGNELNNGQSDTIIGFVVASVQTLPGTGFAPDQVTSLPRQPISQQYASLGSLWLDIPSLNLQRSITGVPANASGWDVTWLGQQVGYLEGTAFPTLAGNTVITAHVWDASNSPGPFINLRYLHYGDIVKVHANGYAYTYQVQESKQVRSWQTGGVFKSESFDWLTLMTCENWNAAAEAYNYRRVVRAVLVAVIPE